MPFHFGGGGGFGAEGFFQSTDLDEDEIKSCSAPNCPGLVKFSFYIAASPPCGSAGRIVCWRMDSATSPSAPQRMTGGWEVLGRV